MMCSSVTVFFGRGVWLRFELSQLVLLKDDAADVRDWERSRTDCLMCVFTHNTALESKHPKDTMFLQIMNAS